MQAIDAAANTGAAILIHPDQHHPTNEHAPAQQTGQCIHCPPHHPHPCGEWSTLPRPREITDMQGTKKLVSKKERQKDVNIAKDMIEISFNYKFWMCN